MIVVDIDLCYEISRRNELEPFIFMQTNVASKNKQKNKNQELQTSSNTHEPSHTTSTSPTHTRTFSYVQS